MLHFISILVKHTKDGRNSDWNMYECMDDKAYFISLHLFWFTTKE
jgi:hypothetical protein